MSAKIRVVITGASGVLGSAIRAAFKSQPDKFELLSLSFSQRQDGLVPLDLQDKDLVDKTLKEFQPDWVIHCAAERRPDVAAKDPEAARRLNAEVPAHLASLAHALNYTLVYISTDYVFDGHNPPYKPESATNPLNLYGETKRDGEQAVLTTSDEAKVIVLRVPVLYGPTPKNSDTAVNILIDVVSDQSGKQYKMDHFAPRFPTNVQDIGQFLLRLSSASSSIPSIPLPRIIHYSGSEVFTKYQMCLIFVKILGLPHEHIIPDAEEPKGDSAVGRPKDCQLDVSETEELEKKLGLGQGLKTSGFEAWWTTYLTKKD